MQSLSNPGIIPGFRRKVPGVLPEITASHGAECALSIGEEIKSCAGSTSQEAGSFQVVGGCSKSEAFLKCVVMNYGVCVQFGV